MLNFVLVFSTLHAQRFGSTRLLADPAILLGKYNAWKYSTLCKLFYHDCLLAGKQQITFETLLFFFSTEPTVVLKWYWKYRYMLNPFMPLLRIEETKGNKKQLWKPFSLKSDFPRQNSPPIVGDNLDSCLSWSELKSKVWLSSLWFPSSIPSTILLRKIGVMEQFHKQFHEHHIYNYIVKITPKGHIFKQW